MQNIGERQQLHSFDFSRADTLIRRGVCGDRDRDGMFWQDERKARRWNDPISAGIAPFHKARLIGCARDGECSDGGGGGGLLQPVAGVLTAAGGVRTS